jgi:hypothetical protein
MITVGVSLRFSLISAVEVRGYWNRIGYTFRILLLNDIPHPTGRIASAFHDGPGLPSPGPFFKNGIPSRIISCRFRDDDSRLYGFHRHGRLMEPGSIKNR